MPNTKSAMKAMRQTLRRRAVNLKALEVVRKATKNVRKAANKSDAQKALSGAFAALDKAAKKGIIHKNNASRKKARLAAIVAKVK